jgi:hypothetical protein
MLSKSYEKGDISGVSMLLKPRIRGIATAPCSWSMARRRLSILEQLAADPAIARRQVVR